MSKSNRILSIKPLLITVLIGLILIIPGCRNKINHSNWQKQPDYSDANTKHAGVFKILDGKWQGVFRIYRPKSKVPEIGNRPTNFSDDYLNKTPYKETLKLDLELDVIQIYESKSEYYQTVKIKDTYIVNGKKKAVESFGVNKVENGNLWCYVQKPDELVIHKGEWVEPDTIIWSRSLDKPLKIEYFREKVAKDTYSIRGWGYYGATDTSGPPSHWFVADYKRIK